MVGYLTSLFACVGKSISYKKGSALVVSFAFASGTTAIENVAGWEFFGIQYSFLILATVLIMLDFFTGALASRYEQEASSGWFSSSKITYTIYKFISLFLLLWMAHELHRITYDALLDTKSDVMQAVYGSTLSTIALSRTTVFALICGREYISIGENIYRRFGKKFYAFTLFEKIFDVVELKFLRKIEGVACPENTKKDETN